MSAAIDRDPPQWFGDPDRARHRSFPALASSVAAARRFVADELGALGADAGVVRDLLLVASELVSNVVASRDVTSVDVTVARRASSWELQVVGGRADRDAPLFDHERWTIAAADELSGRGLGIVRVLVDEVAVDDVGGTVRVRCRRRNRGLTR